MIKILKKSTTSVNVLTKVSSLIKDLYNNLTKIEPYDSHINRNKDNVNWIDMIPIIIFSSVIILIVKMKIYTRNMDQFYWIRGNNIVDFFSYYKMTFIIFTAILVLLILSYKFKTHRLKIYWTKFYLPMVIYAICIILSFLFCQYKEFSLLGFNEHFEGTLTQLSYLLLLFFIINILDSERKIKWIITSISISSAILGILGISQFLGNDFFKTYIGKRLVLPMDHWQNASNLKFTFGDHMIYQTVYNLNYVSFYLTLLLPIFAMLFIYSFNSNNQEKKDFKLFFRRISWITLYGLALFNLIGSKSSGGIVGIAFSVIVVIIFLNRRILKWLKPLAILLSVSVLILLYTSNTWIKELTDSVNTIDKSTSKEYIDYIITDNKDIRFSINKNEIIFHIEPDAAGDVYLVSVYNSNREGIPIVRRTDDVYEIADNALSNHYKFYYCYDKYINRRGLIIYAAEKEWPFFLNNGEIYFKNTLDNLLKLDKVDHIGFENHYKFGSGRGYIWSRTLPMMLKTIFLGHGADTYCLHYPHNDYAGKSNANYNLSIIIDKPHNMYMGIWIGTGGISALAFLSVNVLYILQCIKIYRRVKYNNILIYTGLGIFLGICGFLLTGLMNDSSVSVMPLFYSVLGTGIAINIIISNQSKEIITP